MRRRGARAHLLLSETVDLPVGAVALECGRSNGIERGTGLQAARRIDFSGCLSRFFLGNLGNHFGDIKYVCGVIFLSGRIHKERCFLQTLLAEFRIL